MISADGLKEEFCRSPANQKRDFDIIPMWADMNFGDSYRTGGNLENSSHH